MADFYGGSTTRSGGRRSTMKTEDLQEEDIWATITANEISSITKTGKIFSSGSFSSSSSTRRFTTVAAARPIPRATAGGGTTLQSSAPVKIPDKWFKMLKRNASKKLWDDAYNAHDDGYDGISHDNDDYEMSDDDGDMVPPHEYLATRLASTQIASFSMCEGVGRTLKGRDVTKFRNAILSKTGFLE